MTIKKRLVISNILMIVIPVIVSIITVLVCIVSINAVSQGTFVEYLREERNMRPKATINAQMFLTGFVVIISFTTIMYFTNRFLTKFVFKKIESPLEILSNGVQKITDGKFDYRIMYYQEDEFKPICNNFNKMADQLKTSAQKIEKNENNRKELLASISHDLRSPLTSIKAYVEGLIDNVATTPEAQREYLQIIKIKTDEINQMVSKIFLFSKIDMDEYPHYPEKLNIGKEISDFVNVSLEEYKENGLLIEVIKLPQEQYIFADPTHLRSIFTNILDNSVKYKEKDIVKAYIYCEINGNIIKIIIEDDGPGVPPEAIPKLFDVFYRSDPSRNNPQRGSGLGLAIVAKAVECMQGKIYAENREEGGLRMVIEIPKIKGGIPE